MDFYYLISNIEGDKFIKLDMLQRPTWTIKEKAKRFRKDKAQNLMISNLSKFNCKLYETDELVNPIKVGNGMVDNLESIAKEELKDDISEYTLDYPIITVLDVLDNLKYKLASEKIRLENQLIRCSRALTDIAHYLELTDKISASMRCKLSVFETNVLNKRREIKDNILRVEYAMEKLKDSDYDKELNLDDRLYETRELHGLFENKEIMNYEEWEKTLC